MEARENKTQEVEKTKHRKWRKQNTGSGENKNPQPSNE
jgi:hypothetical protein